MHTRLLEPDQMYGKEMPHKHICEKIYTSRQNSNRSSNWLQMDIVSYSKKENKKKKTKNANARVWGDVRADQKLETCFA